MIRRGLFVIIAAALALSLSGCCCCCCSPDVRAWRRVRSEGEELHREAHEVEPGDATEVHVYLKLDGGRLDIQGGDDRLFKGQFVYSAPELRPRVEYDVQARHGELRVTQSGTTRPNRPAGGWHNEWRLQLGSGVPIDLEADVGASTGEIDLGGLSLKSLRLSAGAANIKVRFSKPNPELLSIVNVRTGASRMSFHDLGNANMAGFYFDGGVGTYVFDFGGQWQRSADVHIKAGTGRVTLRLPHDIGVRVCPGDAEAKGYGDLRRDGECYVNSLYKDAAIQLQVDLDIGVGSLEIR